MTGLAFLHGWGFGPEVWKPLAEAFPERPVALLDAGYFGPERLTPPPCPDGWVGVGHSLGFARLLAMELPWRGLVGFGAFLRFCAAGPEQPGTAIATLDAMALRLDNDPADVLARFFRRCGLKDHASPTPGADGLARLRRDLHHLRHMDMPPPASRPPVLLLHADDDRIAAADLAREAHRCLPGATLHVFASGGHALPFTQSGRCVPHVLEFLHALQ